MAQNLSELYAHTKSQDGKDDFLLDHLRDIAVMAKSFAEKFNSGSLAYWLGFLHDFGKINPLFQSYLSAMDKTAATPKHHTLFGVHRLSMMSFGIRIRKTHGKNLPCRYTDIIPV
jgi:HD-GYP domain-containing protein (c-di-GMP phosphodiesterase class II)